MSPTYYRLGELLVEKGMITNLQLQVALAAQQSCRYRLGRVLVERGFATENAIAQALAEQYGYRFVDPNTLRPSPEALQALPADVALRYLVFPYSLQDGVLSCVICDPVDVQATDIAGRLSGHKLDLAIATEQELHQAICKAYDLATSLGDSEPATGLPARFLQPKQRRKVGDAVQVDATDSLLGRPVSLIGEPATGLLAARARMLAAVADTFATPIFDLFEYEGLSWAVLPRLHGEHLDHILRLRGPRPPAEAAEIVSRMADFADRALRLTGIGGLVRPENIVVGSDGATIVPYAGAPEVETTPTREVARLGTLLRHCLAIGSDSSLPDSIPPMLWDAMRRCDPEHSNAFTSPMQVRQALAACTWSVCCTSSGADRDALLDDPVVVRQERTPVWKRILGLARERAA
jgi:hypothetical protein